MNSSARMPRGLVIGAPATGSGKTTLTLALARLFRGRGLSVSTAKVGPDYIDPAFHEIASGRSCLNLDGWAMRPSTLRAIAADAASDADLLLIEGVMGLFDGAPGPARMAPGSTAQIAAALDLPVVVVMAAQGWGATAGAILSGLKSYEPSVRLAGVIFNKVAGERHRAILSAAAQNAGVPALGFLPRDPALALPSRHLGLVQAREHADIAARIEAIAGRVAPALDLDGLVKAAALMAPIDGERTSSLPPLGQRIAIARDDAFAFAYPAMLEGWRRQGAQIAPFSPLDDEAPASDADAIYLPGGYPELHAGRIAANRRFLDGLKAAAGRGALVLGECGGYMVLGEALIDAGGKSHAMAGLLPVVTSFEKPRLHLGYREATLLGDGPLGRSGDRFRGHEFHYAGELAGKSGPALFRAQDASCRDLGSQGRRQESVLGSFLHLIDRV